MKIVIFLIATFIGIQRSALATDAELIEAGIKETQTQMLDKNKRPQLLQDENSKAADQKLKDFTGSNQKQMDGIYAAAANILGNQKFNSTEELRKWIENAEKNPDDFYKNLSEDQKKKISEIAKEIEAQRKSKP